MYYRKIQRLKYLKLWSPQTIKDVKHNTFVNV
jgi:hypothetical protein